MAEEEGSLADTLFNLARQRAELIRCIELNRSSLEEREEETRAIVEYTHMIKNFIDSALALNQEFEKAGAVMDSILACLDGDERFAALRNGPNEASETALDSEFTRCYGACLQKQVEVQTEFDTLCAWLHERMEEIVAKFEK